jgi:hypothetical protein
MIEESENLRKDLLLKLEETLLISGRKSTLYVVNKADNLLFLNRNDIAEMFILKRCWLQFPSMDQSSNGVVIITTKARGFKQS